MFGTWQEQSQEGSPMRKQHSKIAQDFRKQQRWQAISELRRQALIGYFEAVLRESTDLKSHIRLIVEAQDTQYYQLFVYALREVALNEPYGILGLGGTSCNQSLMVTLAMKILPMDYEALLEKHDQLLLLQPTQTDLPFLFMIANFGLKHHSARARQFAQDLLLGVRVYHEKASFTLPELHCCSLLLKQTTNQRLVTDLMRLETMSQHFCHRYYGETEQLAMLKILSSSIRRSDRARDRLDILKILRFTCRNVNSRDYSTAVMLKTLNLTGEILEKLSAKELTGMTWHNTLNFNGSYLGQYILSLKCIASKHSKAVIKLFILLVTSFKNAVPLKHLVEVMRHLVRLTTDKKELSLIALLAGHLIRAA